MSEKILNLKLKYKNRLLDIARFKRDFNSNFYIGKDKNLFWQILDDSFPLKYKLVTKKASGFILNLQPDMDVSVTKNGEIYAKDTLVQKKIIKENALLLESNSEGCVTFNDNWSIEYYFQPERNTNATTEELIIHRRYAHWPKLSPQDKFTRYFLIFGVIFTIVGLAVSDYLYVPPPNIDFSERAEIVHEMATRVEPEIEEAPFAEPEVEVDITQNKPKTSEEAKEVIKQREESSLAQYEELFGSADGIYDNFEAELFELEFVGDIAVITDEPVASGTPLVNKDNGDRMLENIGKTTSSLKEIKDSGSKLFDMEDLDISTDLGFEEVSLANLDTEGKSLKVKRIENKRQFEAIKKEFAGIQEVSEKEIQLKEITPEQTNDIKNIQQSINIYKPQITKLFMVESMKIEMYGTIEFNLIISKNGEVLAVDTEAAEGSFFTDDFLNKTRNIILKWKILVDEPVNYNFRMKFIKQ